MNPFLVFLLIGLTIMAALNWVAVWLQYRRSSFFVLRSSNQAPGTKNQERSSFQPGDVVVTTRELNWSHGSGTVVPAGEELHLVHRSLTTSGFRWAGHWYYDGEPVYVNSVPEDAIRSSFVVRGSLLNQERPTKNEQPVPSLKAQPEYSPLPLGVTVENQQLGWHWEVRSQFTDQLYESGTEPTELEARKMAFAAYDRVMMDSTPLEKNEEPRTTNEEPAPLTTLQKFERGQPGFKERLRAQLAGKYRPQLVNRLFQLLETPIAELSTNDRRIINSLFASLCIVNVASGTIDNRTSGPIRSEGFLVTPRAFVVRFPASQPSSAG